ncbi:putative DNA topology modulator FlaR [Clostridium bornimense]|uniref:Putative DNA topology modulator FlaR n=1 Tax=Clostridium bornimense TaxID=1216932 RepID=W6SJI2_9CLOT|nr:AAA family ATPase [Clostridium bornimense]CDM69865.1 putative DNA topology modulator FlaR [Clostridium bornimense]
MKIHIIGGSGTGKSYISDMLSNEFNILHFDLDNIFWDNNSDYYGVKMPIDKRTKLLENILEEEDWIIEGVYYSWLKESFRDADYIFILNVSSFVYKYRIILRFLKRKVGIEKGKKETIKSLIELIKWTDSYKKNTLPKIIDFLEPYKNKVIEVKRAKDIFQYIRS